MRWVLSREVGLRVGPFGSRGRRSRINVCGSFDLDGAESSETVSLLLSRPEPLDYSLVGGRRDLRGVHP